ncbi:MAG: hypothetical protein J6B00_01875 [Alphaproteobacteria bacterium]|nr:hypothetical protein [Alphaproteobacteria bacterium]
MPEACQKYQELRLCDCFGEEHEAELNKFGILCSDELRQTFTFELYLRKMIPFVVLGVYLLCAGLLYYKKKNDILLSWVYIVVSLGVDRLYFMGDVATIGCLAIMSLLLIYQLYAWIAKKKMLAVWWFAPHVCLGLFVLYRILRVYLCELDCTFAEAPFMGACRYKCFWEF